MYLSWSKEFAEEFDQLNSRKNLHFVYFWKISARTFGPFSPELDIRQTRAAHRWNDNKILVSTVGGTFFSVK